MWARLMGEEREEVEKQEWGKDECVLLGSLSEPTSLIIFPTEEKQSI